MENHLLTAVKRRVMDELTDSLQRHPIYKDVQVYHKFHALKERQQAGVVLRNASGSRIKMSADDFIGTLQSHLTLARVKTSPGTSLEWVWEDQANITTSVSGEDATASLDATRRVITVQHFPITSGPGNTEHASNIGQVCVAIDGVLVTPAAVDGKHGRIRLSQSVGTNSVVTVGYYANNLDIPGYYFLEMTGPREFWCTPMHKVVDSVVIDTTTGVEATAALANSPVVLTAPYSLYLKKMQHSNKIYLEPGLEYTLGTDGTITFLAPLKAGTTLYASYHWQGADRGPFVIPDENTIVSDAISGAVLAFGTRVQEGDKQVVVVAPQKEEMAGVYGGHYTMQFDILVYARDPISLSEMTDHIVSDIWGNRRQPMISEGLTIDEFDATGESEDSYDDQAGIQFFQQGLSLTIITEWKRFEPYMIYLQNFNARLLKYPTSSAPFQYQDGSYRVMEVVPRGDAFTVEYPKSGYPRLF